MLRILECQVKCQEPILGRLCPQDAGAASFMQGFARQSMLATQRMLEDVSLRLPKATSGAKASWRLEAGASRLWPEECRKLALDEAAIGPFNPAMEYETAEEDASESTPHPPFLTLPSATWSSSEIGELARQPAPEEVDEEEESLLPKAPQTKVASSSAVPAAALPLPLLLACLAWRRL